MLLIGPTKCKHYPILRPTLLDISRFVLALKDKTPTCVHKNTQTPIRKFFCDEKRQFISNKMLNMPLSECARMQFRLKSIDKKECCYEENKRSDI